MLRLTNKVPDIYVDESRDFQLLCRLYDSTNQGIKFHTLKMLDMLTASKLDNRLLNLLADRVGFKYRGHIDDKVLRYIIAAFPYIIKNKGTLLGIKQAINVIAKAENSLSEAEVVINAEDYDVEITMVVSSYNKNALEELLKYVMPAGYTSTIMAGISTTGDLSTKIEVKDKIVSISSSTSNAFSVIRNAESLEDDSLEESDYVLNPKDASMLIKDNIVGAVGTEVVGGDDKD